MSNIIDTIQLSGTVYTIQGSGGAVSSAITSGDTNPVEGGVLYNELRVIKGVETKVELEFSGSSPKISTNFPSGCTKIEVSNFTQYQEIYLCFEGMGGVYGIVAWVDINNGEVSVHEEIEGCNPIYTISGDNLILTWTNVSQTNRWVTHIQYYSNGTIQPEINAILSERQIVPLIDQVSANTQAISGKQDTLSAGTGIQISGNVISATGGGGGNPTVELTQAEYDDLVSAGTVSADTYYIITDATPVDMGNYWTSAQTNSAITEAVSGKQDTLVSGTNIKTVNNESLLGSGNITIQGGGKAISAGTNISVTTGETYDTVSCTLPITANTALFKSISIGGQNSVSNQCDASIVVGYRCSLSDTGADGAAAIGWVCNAKKDFSFAQGNYINANNQSEHSSGQYNVSSSASTTFGNSGNTLFSVGNGTADNARHNAFEIRQNGDIYCNNGTSDVKLQDYIQIKVMKLTQQEYDAITTKDNNTLYVIT